MAPQHKPNPPLALVPPVQASLGDSLQALAQTDFDAFDREIALGRRLLFDDAA